VSENQYGIHKKRFTI